MSVFLSPQTGVTRRGTLLVYSFANSRTRFRVYLNGGDELSCLTSYSDELASWTLKSGGDPVDVKVQGGGIKRWVTVE